MSTRSWFGVLAVFAALGILAPATVGAQARQRYPTQPPAGRVDGGYDVGYRDGLSRGDLDGRQGREFRYENHADYRDATRGWGGYGNREHFRQAYRQGYVEGYRAGYARYGRNTRDGRSYPDGRYGYGYPGPGYPGAYGREYGYDRGFQEGYEEGRDAGRDGHRYDPYRERDYRNADDGYNRRYGARESYKQSYRDGFLAGYQRGYGEGRDSRYRGYRW